MRLTIPKTKSQKSLDEKCLPLWSVGATLSTVSCGHSISSPLTTLSQSPDTWGVLWRSLQVPQMCGACKVAHCWCLWLRCTMKHFCLGAHVSTYLRNEEKCHQDIWCIVDSIMWGDLYLDIWDSLPFSSSLFTHNFALVCSSCLFCGKGLYTVCYHQRWQGCYIIYHMESVWQDVSTLSSTTSQPGPAAETAGEAQRHLCCPSNRSPKAHFSAKVLLS